MDFCWNHCYSTVKCNYNASFIAFFTHIYGPCLEKSPPARSVKSLLPIIIRSDPWHQRGMPPEPLERLSPPHSIGKTWHWQIGFSCSSSLMNILMSFKVKLLSTSKYAGKVHFSSPSWLFLKNLSMVLSLKHTQKTTWMICHQSNLELWHALILSEHLFCGCSYAGQ